MDEVADPILLAWNLDAREHYESLVKPAADFIMQRGPTTVQERWEEIGGYVPHSIATQVAGLIAAADMAEKVGDGASAKAWRAQAANGQARSRSGLLPPPGLWPVGAISCAQRLTASRTP